MLARASSSLSLQGLSRTSAAAPSAAALQPMRSTIRCLSSAAPTKPKSGAKKATVKRPAHQRTSAINDMDYTEAHAKDKAFFTRVMLTESFKLTGMKKAAYVNTPEDKKIAARFQSETKRITDERTKALEAKMRARDFAIQCLPSDELKFEANNAGSSKESFPLYRHYATLTPPVVEMVVAQNQKVLAEIAESEAAMLALQEKQQGGKA